MLKKLPIIKVDDIKIHDDVQQLLLDEALPFEIFTNVCKDFVSYKGYDNSDKAEILDILNTPDDAYDVVYKLNINHRKWINLYFSMRNKDNQVNVITSTYGTYQDFLRQNKLSGKGCVPCNTITMFFKQKGAAAL